MSRSDLVVRRGVVEERMVEVDSVLNYSRRVQWSIVRVHRILDHVVI